MRYTRPDLGENTLAYKGRRYWVIAIKSDGEFEGIDRSLADYVLWDCLDESFLGLIKDSQDQKKLLVHFLVTIKWNTMNIRRCAKR